MVRHDCPTCERERAGTIRGDEYVCATCGESIKAGNVTTADEDLTERDWAALGKQGEPPSDTEAEAEDTDE